MLPVVAPPVNVGCESRTFVDAQSRWLESPQDRTLLFGLPPTVCDTELASNYLEKNLKGVPPLGLLRTSDDYQNLSGTMQIPDAKRLIFDSAKLARLDLLLQELKAGDHRVLIYFQMTRMMDLMEEYLIYRQYKYLRLDGTSKIEDRRDMVLDWQTKWVFIHRPLVEF
jgi:chromatin-remodeling ATPase INO80